MAISCDPEALANAARCYSCITGSNVENVKIYLLAVAAGLDSLTPQQLIDRARCYECIPTGYQKPVITALLCEVASTGEIVHVDCANLSGVGDPTS